MTNIKTAATALLTALQTFVNELDTPVVMADPQSKFAVQACIRGDQGNYILHVQEPSNGSYSKYDIEVSDNEAVAVNTLINSQPGDVKRSLAGTSTRYLVGTREEDTVTLAGGLTFER